MNGAPLQTFYGAAVHGFLPLLAARVPVPSEGEVVDLAAAEAHRRGGSTVEQMMLRARLASAGVAYLPYRDPAFRYLGSEFAIPGGRLDLGWQLPDGRLLFDEVKSGFLLRPYDRAAVGAQVEAQLAGALAAYGERVVGLRVLRLFARELSVFLRADGARIPITEGGADERQHA